MKKILPLLALVILFATACKKDKNEPEPNGTVAQIVQSLDGKVFKKNGTNYRNNHFVDIYTFYGLGTQSDSIIDEKVDSIYSNNIQTQFNITVISADEIFLDGANGPNLYLVDSNYLSKYIVFCSVLSFESPDPWLDKNAIFTNCILTSLDSFKNYVDGILHSSLSGNHYDMVVADYQQWTSAQPYHESVFLVDKNSNQAILAEEGNIISPNHQYFYYDSNGKLDSSYVAALFSYPWSHYDRFEGETLSNYGFISSYAVGQVN